MPRSLNLSLTDELRAFVDQQCGPGTTYATPSEFLRSLLREKKDRIDAAAIRSAVVEGYLDIQAGRVHEYTGDLHAMLAGARARSQS